MLSAKQFGLLCYEVRLLGRRVCFCWRLGVNSCIRRGHAGGISRRTFWPLLDSIASSATTPRRQHGGIYPTAFDMRKNGPEDYKRLAAVGRADRDEQSRRTDLQVPSAFHGAMITNRASRRRPLAYARQAAPVAARTRGRQRPSVCLYARRI